MAWTPRTWWRTASCEPQVPARSRSCLGILFRKPLYCKAEVERMTWGCRTRRPRPGTPRGGAGGRGSRVTSLGAGLGRLEADAAGTASCFASLCGVGSSRARWTPGGELWVSTCTAGVAPKLQRRCYVRKSERSPGERCVLSPLDFGDTTQPSRVSPCQSRAAAGSRLPVLYKTTSEPSKVLVLEHLSCA